MPDQKMAIDPFDFSLNPLGFRCRRPGGQAVQYDEYNTHQKLRMPDHNVTAEQQGRDNGIEAERAKADLPEKTAPGLPALAALSGKAAHSASIVERSCLSPATGISP